MAWSCADKTVKFLVFFFNFLAFLAGGALVGVGVAAKYHANFDALGEVGKILSKEVTQMNSAAYVVIAVGSIIMLLGFLGCCGALCENTCLLGTFVTIMVLLLIVQISGAIVAFVFQSKIPQWMAQAMNTKESTNLDDKAICGSWGDMQSTLKCCGPTGSELTDVNKCPQAKCALTTQGKGCAEAIWESFASSQLAVGIVALVFILLELGAIIFSCCLCQSIKEGDNYGRRYA